MSLYESLNRAVTQPDTEGGRALLAELRRVLRSILLMRRILGQPASILGLALSGALSDDEPLKELASDMVAAVLLPRLICFRAAAMQHGADVANRHIIAALRHHIHALQRAHDRVGTRVYRWCVQTVQRAIELRLVSLPNDGLPLCSETELALSPYGCVVAKEAELAEALNHTPLIADLTQAIGQSDHFSATFIEHSARGLRALDELPASQSPVSVFKFRTLVTVMQAAVRAIGKRSEQQVLIERARLQADEEAERRRLQELRAAVDQRIADSRSLRPLQRQRIKELFEVICARVDADEDVSLRLLAAALRLPVTSVHTSWQQLRAIVAEVTSGDGNGGLWV